MSSSAFEKVYYVNYDNPVPKSSSLHHKTAVYIMDIEQSASQDTHSTHRAVCITRQLYSACTSNSLHHKTAVFCTSNSLHQKTAVFCENFVHIRNFARNNCHSISEEQRIHSLNKCTMKYSACKYNDEVNCTHDTCTGQRSGAKNASV